MDQLNPLRAASVSQGDQVRQPGRVDTDLDGSGAGGGFAGGWRRRRRAEDSSVTEPTPSGPQPTIGEESGSRLVEALDRLRTTSAEPLTDYEIIRALRGRQHYGDGKPQVSPTQDAIPDAAPPVDDDPFAEFESGGPAPDPAKGESGPGGTTGFFSPVLEAERDAIQALRGQRRYREDHSTRQVRAKPLQSDGPGQGDPGQALEPKAKPAD